MKRFKLTSMLTALVVALSMIIAPFASYAEEILTDVVIHKMSVDDDTTLEDHDGKEISDFPGEGMKGVVFKYWKIEDAATESQISHLLGLTDITAIEAYIASNSAAFTGGTLTAATDASGIVRLNDMPEGRYYFAETNGDHHNVTDYIGVPFALELPAMKTDGSGYFGTGTDALHIYPKNVVHAPGLELRKTDLAGKALGGSEFEVYRYDESTSTYVLATDVGTVGKVAPPTTLGNIPAGKYQLVEVKAPGGYLVNNTPVKFTVNGGGITFDTPNSPLASFVPGDADKNPELSIKNEALPEIDKEEGAGGTAQIGETVTWKITVSVPAGIKDYKRFNVTDQIDTRLTLKGTTAADGFLVKAVDGGVETPLVAGTHYNVGYTGNKLTVTFIQAALEPFEGQNITIEYNTTINETAVLGQDIPNDAELDFDNDSGHDTQEPDVDPVKPINPPSVWTGGAKFSKVDGSGSNNTLPGAEFKIATDAAGTQFIKWTAELIAANDTSKFVAPIAGNDIIMVSGADGSFEIKGLAGGTYYLVETKAPNVGGKQYNLLREPAEFAVTKTSHDDSNIIDVINNSGLQIPQTGGIGTVLFTVAGIALMMMGVFMFRRDRQKQN